jgi:hypothetical protein
LTRLGQRAVADRDANPAGNNFDIAVKNDETGGAPLMPDKVMSPRVVDPHQIADDPIDASFLRVYRT